MFRGRLFSEMCFVVAVWRELFPVITDAEPDGQRLPPALLIASNGFLTLVAVAALISIWFGRIGGDDQRSGLVYPPEKWSFLGYSCEVVWRTD